MNTVNTAVLEANMAFAKRARDYFTKHVKAHLFSDDEIVAGGLLGIRYGGVDVIVVTIAADCIPIFYKD